MKAIKRQRAHEAHSREESTRNRQSSSHTEKGWMKKIEDKARSVWRMSPPSDRTQKVSHPPPGQKNHRHISRPEPDTGISPILAIVGAGPLGRTSSTSQGAARHCTPYNVGNEKCMWQQIGTPKPAIENCQCGSTCLITKRSCDS